MYEKMYIRSMWVRPYFVIFIISLLNIVTINGLTLSFGLSNITIYEDDIVIVGYNVTDISVLEEGKEFLIYSEDESVASLDINTSFLAQRNSAGEFGILGKFIGKTQIVCKNMETDEQSEGKLGVSVLRKQRIIDTVFTVSVAIFVSIVYINFGCAINWSELFSILKKPIGPVIGFGGQFILMPLISYGVGQVLFPNNPEMQLGMFFTGVAPAGGASNLWAVLLEGNLNLSIIMTTLSTVAAFGTMPIWIFTLGKTIFDKGNLDVPYLKITIYVVALIIPLAIGFLIQKYFRSFADFMKRILKGLSICLLIFIIVFASATNLYLFKLFSWQIIIASMALPWLGYVIGYIVSYLFGQPYKDCITIAIEIGIQNTGIPIFLLRFALPQPEADLTTIVPVSVSILTPIPLICLYICLKIRERLFPTNAKPKITNDKGIDEPSVKSDI